MATDQLSRTFSALADPTRRAILAMLSRGDATVGDIAAPFAMSLPAISKHLQVLEKAGLISRGREAQWRPARLNAATLAPAADWIDGYRRFWDHSFDALDQHLAQQQKGTTDD
jgi:DNA-binding transcriptional ArsR family regulator